MTLVTSGDAWLAQAVPRFWPQMPTNERVAVDCLDEVENNSDGPSG